MSKQKNAYERKYYLIGPFDVVYGMFSKLQQAKDHLLEMSRNGVRLYDLRPCIYKSCENSTEDYDRTLLKYIEKDQLWAYLYLSWDDYVKETLKLFT